MLANGDIIRVDRTDPRFGAFVMGMGMLGILLDVTLRTVPNRIMRCTKFTTDYPFLLEHNERLNREHGFVKSWWFAWTGESHIWLVDPPLMRRWPVTAPAAASLCCWMAISTPA